MRRIPVLILMALFLAMMMPLLNGNLTLGQLFSTNTPEPEPILFFTNTPQGPTSTPTATPTNTFTPTFTPTNTATPTNTPTPTPTPVGPLWYPDGINSLTGKPYPDEEAMNRANLLVKISNFPPVVRPQSGLNLADVVYEYEVEGGVTRFAALYRSNAPEHVGPIRSGRLVDLELAPMYEALWAYSGSSDPIKKIVEDGEQTPWGYNIFSPQFGDNCEDAGFCRFPKDDLAFEHTLYLNTQMLWEDADKREVNIPYRAKGFAFSEDLAPDGLPANDIFIKWYGLGNARWQYDEETDRYLRYTDNVPHYDALDNSQVWADNLVIIQVPHNNRPDLFEPESKSASVEIALWNDPAGTYGQTAYLIRDGVMHQGYWVRRNETMGSALELQFPNGEPMKLKPGRTWVSIVRWMAQDVTVTEEMADMQATATYIAENPTATPIYIPPTQVVVEPSPESTPAQ